MAQFKIQAVNPAGQSIEETLVAASESEILEQLKAKGLSPMKIEEVQAKGGRTRKRKKLAFKDIQQITDQLSSLLQAKLPLAKSLQSVEEQAENPELAELVADIHQKVQEGTPLSEALRTHPKHFSELYCSIVAAGETGGFLDEAFVRLSKMIEKDQALKAQLKSALTYPCIMMAVMLISVVILMSFVVPSFSSTFIDMGATLPLPTLIVVEISDVFKVGWWILPLIGGGGFAGYKAYVKRPEGRLKVDQLMLALPLVGPLVTQISLSRFALTLGALLRSGVPILQAMESTRDVAGNAHISRILDHIIADLREGVKFGESLRAHGDFFPTVLVNMVSTGEEAGSLDEMLENVGNYFSRESDGKMKTLTTFLEPVIILLMGLLIGFIIIAMLLPIFEMTSLVS